MHHAARPRRHRLPTLFPLQTVQDEVGNGTRPDDDKELRKPDSGTGAHGAAQREGD